MNARAAQASLLALLLIAPVGAALALTFPQLTGRVVDEAGVLDGGTRASLEQKLAAFETKTTGQIVVVTLKSLQGTSIEDYGYQLGRHWGIGRKDKNSGALLIVAPSERKVRIEVGYGLEGQLTDAVSKLIIENSIVPRFRAGDVAGGITRGVDDIIQAVSVDPEEWKSRARRQSNASASPEWVFYGIVILFLFVVFVITRNVAWPSNLPPQTVSGRRRRRGARDDPWGWWGPSSWGGSSGSSGSGWSGGSSDGGGFSGGGGSFGGGGASGSW
jgi:uncharacterized protein